MPTSAESSSSLLSSSWMCSCSSQILKFICSSLIRLANWKILCCRVSRFLFLPATLLFRFWGSRGFWYRNRFVSSRHPGSMCLFVGCWGCWSLELPASSASRRIITFCSFCFQVEAGCAWRPAVISRRWWYCRSMKNPPRSPLWKNGLFPAAIARDVSLGLWGCWALCSWLPGNPAGSLCRRLLLFWDVVLSNSCCMPVDSWFLTLPYLFANQWFSCYDFW
mgnify:CR=1 FL=1